MLLYPILCPAQHAELTARARLVGDWSYVDPNHIRAYRWMAAAMERRGIRTHGRPPVWAWHSYDPPRRLKPDLRSRYYLTTPGTRAFRLTIDAPDELVLLSEFEAWHAVLGNWFRSNCEQEYDAMEALEDSGQLTREMVEASWERIFDLGSGDPDWCGKADERAIQACLPCIELAWVREITPFTARGKPPSTKRMAEDSNPTLSQAPTA